jgi:two-component system nitrate/nitrite response regulator NarL
MAPTRVLLVDDQVMLTDTLTLRFSDLPDFVVLESFCTNDHDLLGNVARLCPDVTVVDVEQAGLAAGELVTGLNRGCPAGHIVVLTGSTDTNLAVTVARAGAAAWVEKTSSLRHLIKVVRGVGRGLSWWPPPHLGAVLRSLRSDVRAGPDTDVPRPQAPTVDTLSPREREVLLGIMANKGQDLIGRELSISVNTVRTHTSSIFAKLGVHSRLAAARVAAAAESPIGLATGANGAGDVVELLRREDPARPGGL